MGSIVRMYPKMFVRVFFYKSSSHVQFPAFFPKFNEPKLMVLNINNTLISIELISEYFMLFLLDELISENFIA